MGKKQKTRQVPRSKSKKEKPQWFFCDQCHEKHKILPSQSGRRCPNCGATNSLVGPCPRPSSKDYSRKKQPVDIEAKALEFLKRASDIGHIHFSKEFQGHFLTLTHTEKNTPEFKEACKKVVENWPREWLAANKRHKKYLAKEETREKSRKPESAQVKPESKAPSLKRLFTISVIFSIIAIVLVGAFYATRQSLPTGSGVAVTRVNFIPKDGQYQVILDLHNEGPDRLPVIEVYQNETLQLGSGKMKIELGSTVAGVVFYINDWSEMAWYTVYSNGKLIWEGKTWLAENL